MFFHFDYADTPDSGYYTLVATTPYGLSVTSSVAKVAITRRAGSAVVHHRTGQPDRL